MNTKYLCMRWQGLLEQSVNLIGHGFLYYHVTIIPSEKTDSKKLEILDQKIIRKYKLNLETRNTFQYRRKKGLANFRYLRWDNIIVILKTEGQVITENNLGKLHFNEREIKRYLVTDLDAFSDIRHVPMELQVTQQVSFSLQHLAKKGIGKKLTVKFTKKMFRDKKAELDEYISLRQTVRVVECFNRLNNIPAWRGIIIQKREIKRYIIKQAKKHGMTIKHKNLFVNASRKKEEKYLYNKFYVLLVDNILF